MMPATVTYGWAIGSSFIFVNDRFPAGKQASPAIATSPVLFPSDGSAWSIGVWEQPGSSLSVDGRAMANGQSALGREFQVNSTDPNDQYDPSIAALPSGNYVVAFTDTSVDANGDIRARVLDNVGRGLAADFGIDTAAPAITRESSVAGLSNGRFVVTWTREFTDAAGNYDKRRRLSVWHRHR